MDNVVFRGVSLVLILAVFYCLGIYMPSYTNYGIYFRCSHSIPIVIVSIGLFIIFERWDMKYSKAVNLLAGSTFSIYLFHNNVLINQWIWQTLFPNKNVQNSSLLILTSVLSVGLVFLMGFLLHYVYKVSIKLLFILFPSIVGKISNLVTVLDTRYYDK